MCSCSSDGTRSVPTILKAYGFGYTTSLHVLRQAASGYGADDGEPHQIPHAGGSLYCGGPCAGIAHTPESRSGRGRTRLPGRPPPLKFVSVKLAGFATVPQTS